MAKGKVRLYNEEQGVGIVLTESGEEIVVYEKGLVDQITTGDLVIFEVLDSPKGKRAVEVKRSN